MNTLTFIRWGALVLLVTCMVQGATAGEAPNPTPEPTNPTDIVDIKVLKTHKHYSMFGSGFNVSRFKVTVVATVTAVERSDSGLQAGSIITISYPAQTYNFPGWTGPPSLPILVEKNVCKAHLTGKQKSHDFTPWGAPDKAFEFAKK